MPAHIVSPRETELRVICHALDGMRMWENQLPPKSESREAFHRRGEELWRDFGIPLAKQLVEGGH
jgi:hypothetical protein